MRNILLLLALAVVLVLAACSPDNQAKDDGGTSDNNQSNSAENNNEKASDNEEENTNKEKQSSEEPPARFSVYIENTTFEFKEDSLEVPFKVAKDKEPLTGGTLGLQVKLPVGNVPFQVKEIEKGKYKADVRVPGPGVYEAKVFTMEDQKINFLGSFKLTFK